ncbi:Hypothetical predicted protein, partial [Olea europaea subsp. europaea]
LSTDQNGHCNVKSLETPKRQSNSIEEEPGLKLLDMANGSWLAARLNRIRN